MRTAIYVVVFCCALFGTGCQEAQQAGNTFVFNLPAQALDSATSRPVHARPYTLDEADAPDLRKQWAGTVTYTGNSSSITINIGDAAATGNQTPSQTTDVKPVIEIPLVP